ncbi:hydrogenase nickel incorporation protein HypB [Methanocaldococcus villosus KIN24-T80]|uniref:Hydrogenase nickel incorporation protein HypB n=1 Tax=Methanocaldococcus villosus KIN24-T80 TaxID=1069083 RepID=N6V2H9_9EURY|nr:hydrogenase nickel incorporation protein HypB [Methanocaldococcus villosus]ENN96468.1 hydrogenase nickel incorporation protein HypB [Methanocaldococcus villosus KIN24-T80]
MHKIGTLEIAKDILKANKRLADENRKLLKKHGIVAFDISGAIGSGKTLLIEKLIEKLKDNYKIACIAGDVIAKYDAERLERHNVKVIPINTGKECHLDAHLIKHALEDLDLNDIDILFIENVGNLICPADFDLGADKRIVVVSTTEGDDIIAKHPEIMRTADLIIINKVDLAKYVGADVNKMIEDAKKINPNAKVITLSLKTMEGFDEVVNYILSNLK